MPPPLAILVADHHGEGLAAHLRGLGGDGLEVEICETLGASRSALARGRKDVIVLDPLARGGAAEVQQLWSIADPSPALLLVSDPGDSGPAIQALAGLRGIALDLVRRDAPLEEFRTRARNLGERRSERAELDELRYAASHDDRTGLLRPLPFSERVAEHFSAAARHGLPLALVLMDLDKFGQINKRFDHTVGDRIIASVGELVEDSLRTEDVGGRLGGDEFGLLLPYTAAVDAARVVRRIRDRLRALSTPVEGTTPLVVTGSLGFESFEGTDLTNVEALRRNAERALRRAKELGGDRGIYFRSLPTPGSAQRGGEAG